MSKKTSAAAIARFDRMCEHMTLTARTLPELQTKQKRGDLDLSKDGAQHRRYQALYEDLLN